MTDGEDTAVPGRSRELRILLIEDDPESLDLFEKSLTREIAGHPISFVFISTFEEAQERLKLDRFDIVATDIYRDRGGTNKANLTERDQEARRVLGAIRNTRFTPVVVFSDSSLPPGINTSSFLKFADKSSGNGELVAAITELIETGIPEITRQLHDELDAVGGRYLWEFLDGRWDDLEKSGLIESGSLLEIVRRRAATAFGRTSSGGDGIEHSAIDGLHYYLIPRIAAGELRLGDIVRRVADGTIGVVLTPHCHLAIQDGAKAARVESALIGWAEAEHELMAAQDWGNTEAKQRERLRRTIQSPAGIGSPAGRYWFLPPFLEIPAVFCDFMNLTTVKLVDLMNEEQYRLLATLDAPFAEAFQSCFLRFYSTVGLPALRVDLLQGLVPTSTSPA